MRMKLFENFSEEFCQELIEQNFPEISITDIKFNDEGWDNQIFVINNELIFRFPRYREASQRLEREIELLNHLQKEIITSIPNYIYKGKLNEKNIIFGGYKIIRGKNLTPTIFNQIHSKDIKKNLASQIAEFLSSLHQFPLKRAFKLNVPRQNKKEGILSLYKEIKQVVFPFISAREQNWANNQFDTFLNEQQVFEYDPVLIHGDFSSDHILYEEELQKIGVIDFSDVSVSDPARDFVCLLDFEKEFEQLVINNYYKEVDPLFLKRRMFYFKLVPFYEIIGGIYLKNQKFIEVGLKKLKELMKANEEFI